MMFTNVSVYAPSIDFHPIPPTTDDCFEILTMLNTGRFHRRHPPQGTIKNYVDNVHNEILKEGGMLICHTVAKRISGELSSWKWQKVSGYLVRSLIDVDFLNKRTTADYYPPYFNIDFYSQQVITYLHHHSVVADSQGNYIECLPKKYPIKKFVFIPHSSGEKGYFLAAH